MCGEREREREREFWMVAYGQKGTWGRARHVNSCVPNFLSKVESEILQFLIFSEFVATYWL